jgi:homoserine kinase type II
VDHVGDLARDVEVTLDQSCTLGGIHGANVTRWCYLGSVGTFTAIGDRELGAIAEAFALGTVLRVEPIAAGTINSNFDVTAARGRFFVRLNEGKSEEDVAWEAALVTLLARSGRVRTLPPLCAGDGLPYLPLAGKFVSVFDWQAGRHLSPGEVTPARARTFGRALADLHVAGLELPDAWRRTSIYDHDHLVARYAHFSTTTDPELARAIAVLGEELAEAGRAAPIRARATHGVIHGDLFRDNVLWVEARAGVHASGDALVAILDFEQASGGSLAYDLAVCLNDWCWDGGPRLPVAAELLAGYQGVRRLTSEDRAALPIEIRAAAARFTITRITDVYLARVTNPDKDFRAFLARCEAWRGPALGQLTATL